METKGNKIFYLISIKDLSYKDLYEFSKNKIITGGNMRLIIGEDYKDYVFFKKDKKYVSRIHDYATLLSNGLEYCQDPNYIKVNANAPVEQFSLHIDFT